MHQGLYVIFEGNEGTGKTSTMKAVAEAMHDCFLMHKKNQPILTHHPGSTPLGAHLRKLVKFPKEIDPTIEMDPLSRQLLYMADTVSFIESILKPTLEAGETVFADRSSFISGLVYSLADEIGQQEAFRLYQLISPPRADRLYVLQCPWEVSKERVQADKSRSGSVDHYDSQSDTFFQKVQGIYDSLLTGSAEQTMMVARVAALENVIYIDATQPPSKVVDDIVADLDREITARLNV
jgi:dTMP kinase